MKRDKFKKMRLQLETLKPAKADDCTLLLQGLTMETSETSNFSMGSVEQKKRELKNGILAVEMEARGIRTDDRRLAHLKTGKQAEAYRAYEELIFAGYQHIQMTLNSLRTLYMEDGDHEMAKKLVEVSSSAASAFEMGKYNEVCFGLEVAAWEKDAVWTAQLMQDILDGIETIGDFAQSKLYQHMALKTVGSEFSVVLKQKLLESFKGESFHYMQGNEYWEKLKSFLD